MKQKKIIIFVLTILLFIVLPVSAWEKKDQRGLIQPGRRVSGSIDLVENEISYSYRTYRVRVPENVFKMEVQLDSSFTDLDLYMNYNREIENYDNTDYYSARELFNEKLLVSRFSQEPLVPGLYFIDVVYPLDSLPVIDNTLVSEISFGLTVKLSSPEEPEHLLPGQAADSSLSSEKLMMKYFSVEVPEEAGSLRIDLFKSSSDLDMFVNFGEPALTSYDADYLCESYLGEESLVINGESIEPLRAGTYYISVFDRIEDSFTDTFSIVASLGEDAPDFLKQYPSLPEGISLLDNALYATVEISTKTGSGSGCIVSDDGYIITGLHVITDVSGEISEEAYISMNLSNYYPPVSLFKAKLIQIREEEDLALLKIESGLYGQPLPSGYNFPYYSMALSEPVSMGQPLSFLGYPQIGSEGSRASISFTKGIVSGFDAMDFGYLIKTDGEINSGNSGGAAFNDKFELIGFPMSVISDDGGQIAYIHPVTMIPEEWLGIIIKK